MSHPVTTSWVVLSAPPAPPAPEPLFPILLTAVHLKHLDHEKIEAKWLRIVTKSSSVTIGSFYNMFVETVSIKCKLNKEVLTRYKTRQFHLQG